MPTHQRYPPPHEAYRPAPQQAYTHTQATSNRVMIQQTQTQTQTQTQNHTDTHRVLAQQPDNDSQQQQCTWTTQIQPSIFSSQPSARKLGNVQTGTAQVEAPHVRMHEQVTWAGHHSDVRYQTQQPVRRHQIVRSEAVPSLRETHPKSVQTATVIQVKQANIESKSPSENDQTAHTMYVRSARVEILPQTVNVPATTNMQNLHGFVSLPPPQDQAFVYPKVSIMCVI
jgi:hypothetical protein